MSQLAPVIRVRRSISGSQRFHGRCLAAASLVSTVALAQNPPAAQQPPAPPVVAFTEVTVIPMDREGVLERQTVLVRDGRIERIGPSRQFAVPEGATFIDGRGKYLIPGLADMHTHAGGDDLLLFVANGVTTIRVMWGSPDWLRARAEVGSGQRIGPTIHMAGPILDGRPPLFPQMQVVTTARAATQTVRETHAAGYDFIKVYNSVPVDAYRAIVAEARRLGMPVAGHVPLAVGLRGALDARQSSIEHLRGYIAELVPPSAAVQPSSDLRSRTLAWNYADESRFAELARLTREAGVWNCPTLVVHQTMLPAQQYARRLDRPEMQYESPAARADNRAKVPYLRSFTEDDYRAAQTSLAVQQRFVKALHDAGARLLVGTDVGVSGFSLHEELRHLVAAGLSPYEALRAGTRDAAEFFGQLDEWGTLTVGRRADLVLLEANPLDNIENAGRVAGVMLRGRWLPQAELQRMLAKLATARSTVKQ